jgi:hypothetical protein
VVQGTTVNSEVTIEERDLEIAALKTPASALIVPLTHKPSGRPRERALSHCVREKFTTWYVVLGCVVGAHILLKLFVYWSVSVRSAVAFNKCRSLLRASHVLVRC